MEEPLEGKDPAQSSFLLLDSSPRKLLTIDNLRKRGIGVLDWGYMCKGKTETVDHLLCHCPIALELWSMVFGLFWWCIGSCPNPLLICLLLGMGALKSIEMVLFGKLLCIVLCGVFGGRGMLKVLKISKETYRILNCSF